MKKINIFGKQVSALLLLGILLAFGVAATSVGYVLLTTHSNFSIEEAFEAQYYEVADGQWHDLPLTGPSNQVTLGAATLMPGETNTFYVRVRNMATSGNLGATLEITNDVSGLTHGIVCDGAASAGVQYEQNGNVFHVKVPSGGAWQEVGMTTSADGNAAPGVGLTFDSVLSRSNALSTYAGLCS